MRLKYKPDIPGGIVIRLKEEPATYYDECTAHKLGDFVRPLSAHYSEKGELVEIIIYTGDLEKEEGGSLIEFEKLEKEAMIPDILPARKYVFLYGKEDGEPKGCVDSFTEICNSDDLFDCAGYLTMWRLDGKEMNKSEIWELRNDFIEDVFRYLDPVDWFVESVYWDKRLYFWKEEVGDIDLLDLLNCVEVIIETLFPYFEELLIERKERKMGVDFIITDPVEKELNFCVDFNDVFHTNFSGKEVALICIYDKELERDENETMIGKEELIEICRKTDEYENRMIILGYGDTQLSEEAIEYAERQNIAIRKVKEIIKMRYIKIAKWNDEDPELFEDIYAGIFGEDRGA